MSSANWKRCYTMKCGPAGKSGFQIGNISKDVETPLHIAFSIEKCDTETANTAKVQIWNLSPANLRILEKEGNIIELRAGYENSLALIMAGTIQSVTTTASNADRVTELEVTDGGVDVTGVFVSLSYNKATNCKKIYDQIASSMGVTVSYAQGTVFKTLPNGFTYIGTAAGAYKKLSSMCGHSVTFDNGVMQVKKAGSSMSKRAYLLSPDTGLLGIPKKISISTDANGSAAKSGYQIEYFLNGAISVNSIVRLDTKEVSGDFQVYKITMDGDNYDGDWVCTAEIFRVDV